MAHIDLSDGTLVLLTLAGDRTAFETLVTRHEAGVRAAAYTVVHNVHIAEDSAQDAFVAAWIKLDMLREPDKFGIWVRRIAKNCAKNMATQFSRYLSLEEILSIKEISDGREDPEELLVSSDEREQLRRTVDALPDRAKQVVFLHYYEDLSVSEIAERLSVSEGTVKWQLHDGRKKMRKELCAVNETINDTLLQRVMKKVEELKEYKFKNSKDSFESAYRSVLKDVEDLPETQNKYHALADVLMMGSWWVPGENNDKLYERIKEAARLGKNEDVMCYVVQKESNRFYGEDLEARLRNEFIPNLEKEGFPIAATNARMRLSEIYLSNGRCSEAKEVLEKAASGVGHNIYRTFALAHLERLGELTDGDFQKNKDKRKVLCQASEILRSKGELRFADEKSYSYGALEAVDIRSNFIIYSASCCDKYFTVGGLAEGESYRGSDGSTLTREANADIETPCGVFRDCEVWSFESADGGRSVETCYKEGVGIVRQTSRAAVTMTLYLSSYEIIGGSGLLPLAVGNRWEYSSSYTPEIMEYSSKVAVIGVDGNKTYLTQTVSQTRHKYDENSWQDMMIAFKDRYYEYNENGSVSKINDVSYELNRAAELASTPLEKAHTKAASSVANRIKDTFPDPDAASRDSAKGLWNFFRRAVLKPCGGTLKISDWEPTWCFELKSIYYSSDFQALHNHLFDQLQNCIGYVWSDDWKPGYEADVGNYVFGVSVSTHITCSEAGTVETPAGSFDSCMKATFETKGLETERGVAYIGSKKEYFYAPRTGLVKAVFYPEGMRSVTFLLVSFKGTGEGYMPFEDGFERRYETVGTTDGVFGAADYIFVDDGRGNLTVMCDLTGIRNPLQNISEYSLVMDERERDRLLDEDKYAEANEIGFVNAFKMLLHSLKRGFAGTYDPLTRAKNYEYRFRLCRSVSTDGEIPPAFYGLYSWYSIVAAAAFSGAGHKEESYHYIDEAIEYVKKWLKIPEGEKLSVGDPAAFGGIVYIKGKNYVLLPNGAKMNIDSSFMSRTVALYDILTAKSGWEWFNPIRDEERFKEAIDRAKKLV